MNRRSNLQVMAKLIGLVRPLCGWMAMAIVMGVLGFLCATFITVLGGYGMLQAIGLSSPLSLRAIFLCVAAFAVLRGLLRYGEQACNHFIAFKLLALIRDRVFAALCRLCPAKLEGRDRGDLIALITSDIELLEVFYAHTISPAAIALLMSLLMCGWIGQFHWLLGALAALAYVTVGVAIPVYISRRSGTAGMALRTQSGELSSFVLDSLRGLQESIQYGTGQERLAELGRRTQALSQQQEKLSRMTGRNSAITQTCILAFDLCMLAASAGLYAAGAIGFAGVVLSTIAMMSSFGPVVALANLGSSLQNTLAAGNRVLDILEESPVVEAVQGQAEVAFAGAACEHVTFAYEAQTILSDLSLSIPKGKVTGIVGKSGSGKSTLLKLLMRFWDVDQGRVTISQTDIARINTDNLRAMESFVTQDTHLFHDSIANNVRIAKLDATQQEIERACQKASIHAFIEGLPHGYETNVGELGDTLSGGERQRIGLARAFLHDAPLMLLDEPTSNLDSLNEAVILNSLHEAKQDKTVVLVSHRASTVRIADTVCRVEGGRMC